MLYVYNSKLIYRARHCLLCAGGEPHQLSFAIADLQDVNSCNKFTSRKVSAPRGAPQSLVLRA